MTNRYETHVFHTKKRDLIDKYTIHSYKYALFPKDDAVSGSIIEGWQYEPYIFEFIHNNMNLNGGEVLDIGANNGNFTIDFAMLVGDSGKVHSFEPQRIIFYQLCGNVFMNGLTNVYCHNVALCDDDIELKIDAPNYYQKGFVNFGDVGVCSEQNTEKDYELVRGITLDSMSFNDVRFIKMDIQGYELQALKGSIKTIKKHRPIIILEIEDAQLKKYGQSSDMVISFLERQDYSVIQLNKGMAYHSSSGYCVDYVAIPKEKDPSKFIVP